MTVKETNCPGCPGCGPRPDYIEMPAVQLNGLTGEQVAVEMPATIRFELLWNSWLKPLCLIFLAATLCSLLGLPDGTALGVTLGSLILGLALCRALPISALKLRKLT